MRISKTWTISLPPTLEREARLIARREHRTKSELIREALRTYLTTRQWQAMQKAVAPRARRLGLRSEGDVEGLVDDLRR